LRTADYDYQLPGELIAQTPLANRGQSRLMVLHRKSGAIGHHRFSQLPDFVHPGDLLVLNDSRVLPARLYGRRAGSGGRVEMLLLRRLEAGLWEALVRPARRVRPGDVVELTGRDEGAPAAARCTVVGQGKRGIRTLRFDDEATVRTLGEVALPPYVHVPLAQPERYQTVYARNEGSVAAPTAGLHFTPEMLAALREKGARFAFVTLHIGLDTFRPVAAEDPRQHTIHREYGVVPEAAAREIQRTRAQGRRVICVGTTSVRVVEAAAGEDGTVRPLAGWVDLFILPGYRFRVTDAMLTNFHLPRSTLLMLVSAFAGRDHILRAYREAAAMKYRFYSFGDAMLIV